MISNELLSATWCLDQGTSREMLSMILSKRLDVVMLEGSNLEQFRHIERLGFPLELAFEDYADSRVADRDMADTVEESSFVLNRALYRCRLLPYLSYSKLPVQQHAFSVSTEDVRRYGEQSGDLNPLHFDDEFARKHGFAGRISHGMLFNGWLTRLLGTKFPGSGTIYLRSICVYFAPVYPDKLYGVRISTPLHDPSRGFFRIVAQLLSNDGRHATIAYADLLNRAPN